MASTASFSLEEKDVASSIKRSATSVRRTTDNIDAALVLLRSTLATLHSHEVTPDAAAAAVTTLQTRLREANILGVAKDDHKVVHASLSKLLKACDKSSADTAPATAPIAAFACDCQRDGLNAAIVDHFCRASAPGAAAATTVATLLSTALPVVTLWPRTEPVPLPSLFSDIHAAADRVRVGDVATALAWCTAACGSGDVPPHSLRGVQDVLYDLNVLHAQQLLCGRLWLTPVGTTAAAAAGGSSSRLMDTVAPTVACDLVLAFARERLPTFLTPSGEQDDPCVARRRHVARIVTAALFLRALAPSSTSCTDILAASPYADLVSAPMHAFAARAADAYVRVRCETVKVDAQSPLSSLFAAGMIALPQLQLASRTLRLPAATSYAGGEVPSDAVGRVHAPRSRSTPATSPSESSSPPPRTRGLSADAAVELPLDAPVPQDMVYHSVFCCPVSRQPAVPVSNPPVLLTCGHVISKESLQRIAATRPRFKCPTCPVVMTAADAVELKLE